MSIWQLSWNNKQYDGEQRMLAAAEAHKTCNLHDKDFACHMKQSWGKSPTTNIKKIKVGDTIYISYKKKCIGRAVVTKAFYQSDTTESDDFVTNKSVKSKENYDERNANRWYCDIHILETYFGDDQKDLRGNQNTFCNPTKAFWKENDGTTTISDNSKEEHSSNKDNGKTSTDDSQDSDMYQQECLARCLSKKDEAVHKPTKQEIIKYMKKPLKLTDRDKIKREKGFKKKSEAMAFILEVQRIVSQLSKTKDLSKEKEGEKIDDLLKTPPDEPSPPSLTEEEEKAQYRKEVEDSMASIVRHQEKTRGLKKGEIQYSLSFAMDDDDKNVLYKDEL